MRLLVSEFVTSGAVEPDEMAPSLLQEGRSMLLALLQDALLIPDLQVTTIWGTALGEFPLTGVEVLRPESAFEEMDLFAEHAAGCDRTLIIAPEFDGILTQRALLVEGVGGRLCGPNPLAIAHCSDKFELAQMLTGAGVPSILTADFQVADAVATEMVYPAVIKPRDGAGSQDTYLVQAPADLERLRPLWKQASLLKQAVWQPYIAGRAVSVGVLITPEQYLYEALPPCEQTLTSDGRFSYLGGVVPGRDLPVSAIQETALAACRAVPGLRGYVGVDLIVPQSDPARPVVVEINPRMTTSYLGYARLCHQNLLARLLGQVDRQGALTWKAETIAYQPDGEIRLVS